MVIDSLELLIWPHRTDLFKQFSKIAIQLIKYSERGGVMRLSLYCVDALFNMIKEHVGFLAVLEE